MTLYGYFDDPDQDQPAFDPGMGAPCPLCGETLQPRSVTTISLFVDGDNRSYFYRVHRDCFASLPVDQQRKLDDPIVEAVLQARSVN